MFKANDKRNSDMSSTKQPKKDSEKSAEFLKKRSQRLKNMHKAKKNKDKDKDKGGFFFFMWW